MSGHGCTGDCQGSYKPQRKIVIPKAKLAIIIDERMKQNVSLAGILELSSLISKNPFFFSTDENYAKEFCEGMKNFPEQRANLICAINKDATEFTTFSCYKGKVTVSTKNFNKEDIAPTYIEESNINNYCDYLIENTLSVIPVFLNSMMIMRCLTTITPQDNLLAKHYLKQYVDAKNKLSADDLELTFKIKEQGLPTFDDNYSQELCQFLRIERKLYIQYEH